MERSIKHAEECRRETLALRDAIELLNGKWKLCILQNLFHFGTMRFKDLIDTVDGITPKVLSKELQVLEQNLLVTRTVNNTRPITVSYAVTKHAGETKKVISSLLNFGQLHRKKITGK